ncbi:TonB-dependent receptor [Flavobacterium faecale]|uniref:TonB-dependent receptor n=1 Tax=Flavobacterium faecale TaxID=1355330 RepID=A0A2S1LII6_9FLAO|nr:TonB-dependent receptor [Flavobacterium faecale]AWG23605.1 TonB-dependent receptor [Flavobacterium faecale]
MKKIKLLELLFFLFSIAVANAQMTTSRVAGKVFLGNTPLADANVVLLFTPRNSTFKGTTDRFGRYSFENMPVGGPYKITITSTGLKTFVNASIQLSLGDNDIPNITLIEEGQQLSEIVVKSSKKVTKSGGASFNERQINNLPTISRGIQDITKLTPQSANNSFAGTNFRYNNVTIDGSINNDAVGFSPSLGGATGTSGMPGSSTRSNSISLDAIQDIQVFIAPYDVKLGNFLGGSINAVTRSGSNEVTGSVYSFARNASITGRNYAGDKAKMPSSFEDYQTGFRVGFPIIKDKLFYFTNAEVAERKDPLFYNAGTQGALIDAATAKTISDFVQSKYNFNPGSSADYSIFSKSKKFFNKVDWKINNKHTMSLRNNAVISSASNLERDAANFRFSSIDFIQKSTSINTVLEFKSRFNERLSNNFIASYSTVRDQRNPTSSNVLFPQVEIGINGGTVLLGNDREATVFNMKQNTTEITDNLTYRAGNHNFTLGTHNEFYDISYGFVNALNGRISYKTLADFLNATPSRVRGTFPVDGSSRDEIFNNPYAKFKVNLYSAYFQDEIKIGSKLKVTPGIRADYTDVPNKPLLSSLTQNAAVDPLAGTTYSNTPVNQINSSFFKAVLFSPRVGFNYDVKGDNSLVIRGGSGVFTGRIPFAWLGYAFYNDGVGYNSYDANNLTAAQVATNGDPLAANGLAKYQTPNRKQVDLIDNNFKMPQVVRSSLAVDYRIAGYKFSLEGIYTKVIRDLQFQQVNLQDKVSYYSYDVNKQQPIYSGARIDNNFSNAYLLSNTNQGHRYSLTGQVSKSYDFGFNFMAAYTYGQSKDITNGIRNSMESNYQMNQSLTPNNPQLAYSNFDIRHRIVSNLGYQLQVGKSNTVACNMYFNAQSGAPFSWGFVNSTLAGTGQAAGLAYIPTEAAAINFFADKKNGAIVTETAASQAANFNNFVSNDSYLSSRRGTFTERNGARTPWNIQADLKVQDDIKVKINETTYHTIQVSLSIVNFSNMLNHNWGRNYFVPNTFNSTSSVGLTKVGSVAAGNANAGDPLFNFTTPTSKPYSVDQFASRFQGQLGLRYSF